MAVNEWVPMDTDDYTVGQITLTVGSSDVTFTNAFNGAESSFYAGDSIYVPTAGKWLLLASITNRTAGTLLYPCPADCAGTFDLRLRPLSRNARQAGLAAMVLRNLQVGNLPALADLTLAPGQVPVAGQVQGSFDAGDLPTAPDLSPYMKIETYDKNGKKADVYDAGNLVENKTAHDNKGALLLTNAERQAILDNTDGLTYKSSDRYNWIINGGFTLNQRGVSSPRDVASGVYGYDRWKGNANGLEQVVEALPSGEFTLTWSGGGTGYLGSTSGASPLKATSAGGNVSVIVPKAATNVSLVAGDAAKQDPWPYVQRAPAIEIALCQRYYETGVTYQGGWTAQFLVGQSVPFKVTKRTTPTLSFSIKSSVNVSNPRAQNPNINDFVILLDIPSGANVLRSLYELQWIASADL